MTSNDEYQQRQFFDPLSWMENAINEAKETQRKELEDWFSRTHNGVIRLVDTGENKRAITWESKYKPE